jgi:TPR repeat protein
MKSLIASLLIIYAPIGLSQHVALDNLLLAKAKSAQSWDEEHEGEDDPGILADAKKGNAAAQYAYGMINYQRKNYKVAADWFLKAANQGHQNAQYYLGKMYQQGLGVEKNYARAYFLYSLSADKGFADSIKAKTTLAKKMTPKEIADAKKMYQQYKPKKVNKTKI